MLVRASSGSGGGSSSINNAVHKYIGTPPSNGYIELGFKPELITWSFDTTGSLRTFTWNAHTDCSSNCYYRTGSNAIAKRAVGNTMTGNMLAVPQAGDTGFTISGAEYITNLDVYAS